MTSSTRIEIGRIVKPHGIRGEVVVEPLTDRVERFAVGTVLHTADRDFTIAAVRPHQGRLIVRLEDIEDRTTAERLRGITLEVDRPEGEEPRETYEVSELVGLPVEDEDGRSLGAISALIELPDAAGYDLLEITRDDGSTWLLPAVEEHAEIVLDGDTETLVVRPPDGLLDDANADVVPPS